MVNWTELGYLIPLLPFIGFLLVAFVGKRTPEKGAPIAIGVIGMSFVLSVLVFFHVLQNGEYEVGWEWVEGTGLEIGMLIDNLTALMLIVVSFISLMVVIYSVGYMKGDEGLNRYYAEICLFVGAMLGLVMANNYFLMFIFWELVGLSSYLLIGFWYKKPSAASAAKKAFLVTRIGDVLLLAGIVMFYTKYDTFNFRLLEAQIGHDFHGLLLPVLLLFGGAVGKSAQFPLHVWLPDAMEGPTTVSALIHAATMVNAGIYLVARSYPIITHIPDALLFIAVIGGITALMAATMAIVQYDIKRVLAYSTISQLGYMTMALGAGALAGGYTAGMFHLMNHAFFKALLFLAAGSVIHAVGTNDMRLMGGLRKKMKITSLVMLIGAISIAGVPFLSGFFSKDEVLSAVYHAGVDNNIYYVLYAVGIITAFLTAFYMFRLWFMTFSGEPRSEVHAHESPKSMTVPLMLLAGLAIISGYSFFFGFADFIWMEHVVHLTIIDLFLSWLTWVSIVVALSGIGLAYLVYYKGKISASVFTAGPGRRWAHRVLENKYYMDHLFIGFAERVVYGFALLMDWVDRKIVDGAVNGIGKGTLMLGRTSNLIDMKVIDGTVNGISKGTMRSGSMIRKLQSGKVQDYATAMIIGACGLMLIMILMGGF